jgi:DNA-directed RNA polymerase specialized sigma24 family protein
MTRSFALFAFMSDITRILSQIELGDPQAAEQLLPLVYNELRKLAASKLAQEQPGQTLQATALVHEAYLRLVGPRAEWERGREGEGEKKSPRPLSPSPTLTVTSTPSAQPPAPAFNSRGHFFAAAAEAMRRILVEQARRRKAIKRGGGAEREELHESAIAAPRQPEELLAVHECLDALAAADPLAAQLVKLRFFVGLTTTEAAEAVGISVRSAHDVWAYARAWLHQRIAEE